MLRGHRQQSSAGASVPRPRSNMPVGYNETRKIVFLKLGYADGSCSRENSNEHQSVPSGPDLVGLRPEWISSLHPVASAQRSRGTVPRSDVRFEISAGRLWASGDFGGLLLINRYVPLALTILGPIIVNILLLHVLMNPDGLGVALFATILWAVVFASVRSAFAGIFQARVDIKTTPEHRHSQAVSPA